MPARDARLAGDGRDMGPGASQRMPRPRRRSPCTKRGTTGTDSETPGAPDPIDAIDPERLVRENIGWMLALTERILRDRQLAEDSVQDAFLQALRGLDGFQGRSSLKTWLRRIAINAALSRRRQMKRLAEQPIDEHLPEFDRHDCRVEAPWSHLATVQEVMEREDLRRQVSAAIDALPDAYRIVLQLRDVQDCDTAEVAALLEISTGNVKVRLHRARAALKKLLEPVLRGEASG